ncbi:MAG: hypothetical protein INR69_18745 [Mucilaginibacter polytrichastri]|nr:hypothetical protein [Mucilaginibacter polytrichastri]
MKLLFRLFFVFGLILFLSDNAYTLSTPDRAHADFITQNPSAPVRCHVCVLQEVNENTDQCSVSTTSTEFRRKLLIESVEEDDDDSFSSKRHGELNPVLGALIGYGFFQAFYPAREDLIAYDCRPHFPSDQHSVLYSSKRYAALRVFRI